MTTQLTWTRDRAGIYITTELFDRSRFQAERHGNRWHLWLYTPKGASAAPSEGGNTFYGDWFETLADAKVEAERVATRRNSARFYVEQTHLLLGEASRFLRIARRAALDDDAAAAPVVFEAIDDSIDSLTAQRRRLVEIIATTTPGLVG